MLEVTGFYVAILAFIYIKLTLNVIKLRRLHKVRIGFKNHKDLEQAIRDHANFNEFVPLGLILLACLEINQVHKIIIIILGGLLFIGRFLHARSFTIIDTDIDKRTKGMQFTLWSIRLMSAVLILSLLASII